MMDTLYAYVNIDHPMVAWEVAIGRIKSSDEMRKDGFGISLWYFNMLSRYVSRGENVLIRNEMRLELIRAKHFPESVSRLRGVYFFETRHLVEQAFRRWGMRYNSEYVAEVEFNPDSISKVDSEWITNHMNAENGNFDWMHKYWQGEKCGEVPLTEVLAGGMGVVLDKDLRKKAYRKIMAIWPDSIPLLYSAMFAFQSGGFDNVALTKPGLLTKGKSVEAGFYIDMNDLNKREAEICSAIQLARDSGCDAPIIRPGNEQHIFHMPDLASLRFEYEVEDFMSLFQQVKDSLSVAATRE